MKSSTPVAAAASTPDVGLCIGSDMAGYVYVRVQFVLNDQ
jgi:hypothetical protein